MDAGQIKGGNIMQTDTGESKRFISYDYKFTMPNREVLEFNIKLSKKTIMIKRS